MRFAINIQQIYVHLGQIAIAALVADSYPQPSWRWFVSFVARASHIRSPSNHCFSHVSEEFMRHRRVAWLSLVPLSRFSIVSGSFPVSRCFSGVSRSPASSSTYRAVYALESGAPSLTCLSARDLSVYPSPSVIRLAGRSDCLRFFFPPHPPFRFVDS
jgi:hypothetical protein